MNNLFLYQQELGPMQNYIYFIGDKDTKEVAIIDPAWDVNWIRDFLESNGLILKALFITHGHKDHTNGIVSILKYHDIPVYVSKHEAEFYKPISENLKEVSDNYKVTLGEISVNFLHTPGHTPGSQCFMVENYLIAGDTLFLDGCGRCDLPGGNAEIMYETIHKKLMQLPHNTIIYPGHNYHILESDTLENQKKTNKYMKCEHLQSFLKLRMPMLYN